MNLRDLRYILAVADVGQFGKAADACHVSQPTLSGQILKLEEELGVMIFERVGRSVRLTPTGERIVARARRAVQAADDILQLAQTARDPLEGPLNIGAIPTIAPYLMPHVLPAAAQRMPNTPLVVREDVTDHLIAELSAGRLDAAIIATDPVSPLLDAMPLYDEPFWVALPSRHELAQRKRIATADLDPKELLLLADGHCLRDQALELCRHSESGHAASADIRALSLETLMQLAAAGYGVTLAPELCVESRRGLVKGLVARPLAGRDARRRVRLAFRKNAPRLKALDALANVIRQAVPRKLLVARPDEELAL
jgi:LysR family hydrogen peroxide-inducible transcriptional activator